MEHTKLTSTGSGPRAAPVHRKGAADVGDVNIPESSPETASVHKYPWQEVEQIEGAPKDLSILVHQLYAQIKRELQIERERRGGLY